ncbi:hypothetical protein SKZB199_1557 [Streptococcus sp. ZB199]|nr:hypothetical protein SKZB199_1557 [Streptococcus sp. ZB199]
MTDLAFPRYDDRLEAAISQILQVLGNTVQRELLAFMPSSSLKGMLLSQKS